MQTSTPGLKFEEAWQRRETMEYQDQKFFVASREDLIASKRASGRPVDLEDVRLLELDTKDEYYGASLWTRRLFLKPL